MASFCWSMGGREVRRVDGMMISERAKGKQKRQNKVKILFKITKRINLHLLFGLSLLS